MKRQLFRRFVMLLSGTTAAQLLPVVTAPVIARHYEAAEFGAFGIYFAASSICATVANLKYDNVILATRSRSVTQTAMGFSLVVNLALGAVIALGMAAAVAIGALPASATIAPLILLLPLSLLVAGSTQALANVALQREQFSAVARSRIVAASVTAGASLLAALVHPTAQALIGASLAGQGLGLAMLALACAGHGGLRPSFRLPRLRWLGRRHWRFALFTSPADLLNALASNLPALFLSALYGNAATGAYVLTQRLLGTPLMLIGSAFSDLYRQHIGRLAADGRSYWPSSVRMLATLAGTGLCTLALVLTLGRGATTAFLGAQWALVGDVVTILAWVYVVRFVVSPLTFSFYLAQRHVEDLVLQALSASAVGAIYLVARHQQLTLTTFLTALAAALTTMYLIYGVRSMQFAHRSGDRTPRLPGRAAS